LRGAFLLSLLFGFGQSSHAQQPATWWPDPATGIMWTGSEADPKGWRPNYSVAEGKCAALTTGGYTDWRLPTLDEFTSVAEPATFYAAHNARRTGQVIIEYSAPAPGSELMFNGFGSAPLWTSTPAGPGQFYLKDWTPPGSSHAAKVTDQGDATGSAAVFCVRAIEPELLHLAKDAHPPTPVTGVQQLKSVALQVRAEDATKADNFAEGISDATQALALDPKSIRGLHDLGIASAYSGNFAEALSSLETAHSLDKNLTQTNDDIKWVKAIQKQAATDPKAMQAWVLVHDADVAQSDESFERAIAAANEVVSLEPSWPEGYDRLGVALAGVNQWQDAITALSKAVSLDKHHETSAKQDLKTAKQMQKKKVDEGTGASSKASGA
jgi:hypothetical protein